MQPRENHKQPDSCNAFDGSRVEVHEGPAQCLIKGSSDEEEIAALLAVSPGASRGELVDVLANVAKTAVYYGLVEAEGSQS